MSGWEGILNEYGPMFKDAASKLGDGLIDFSKSPEAMDLAAGLLSQATPSMTEPRSFAGGLSAGIQNMSKNQILRAKAKQKLTPKLTGLPQEYASLEQAKSIYGADNPIIKKMERALELREQAQESLIGTREEINKRRDFSLLPVDNKVQVLSEYAGLGINEKDAVTLFNAGRTPQIVAQERKNLIPNEDIGDRLPQMRKEAGAPQAPANTSINKKYPATSATRTAIQSAEGGLAEEEYAAPIFREAMGPYARKFAGYSPRQMVDALSSDPQKIDKVAKFYAARALQQEMASFRARMSDGSSAGEALQHIQADALNKIKILESQVSPEAYIKAHEYMSKWITGMTKARIAAMKNESLPSELDAPKKTYKQSDLEYTAKKRDMTVDQVLAELEGR